MMQVKTLYRFKRLLSSGKDLHVENLLLTYREHLRWVIGNMEFSCSRDLWNYCKEKEIHLFAEEITSDEEISREFRCPECGGRVIVSDTMMMKTWICVSCEYQENDW